MVFIKFSRDLQPQNIKTMAWFPFQGTEVRENEFSLKMNSWWNKSSTSTTYFELHKSAWVFLCDLLFLPTIHSLVLHVLHVISRTLGTMWLGTGIRGMVIVEHIVGTLDAPISNWVFGERVLGLRLDCESYGSSIPPQLPVCSVRSGGKWKDGRNHGRGGLVMTNHLSSGSWRLFNSFTFYGVVHLATQDKITSCHLIRPDYFGHYLSVRRMKHKWDLMQCKEDI